MKRSRVGCVSIDLDELVHYARIHGLPEGPWVRDARVCRVGGERFGELMSRHGIAGTAFVIGESLDAPEAAGAVRRLSDAGHEIGNHTWSHDYRLDRRPDPVLLREVARGEEACERVTGRRPVGFRAPGYNVDERLLRILAGRGYRYDASVLPAPAYLAARATVIGAMRLAGRRSASQVGRLQAMLAPARPYRPRPGAFWRPGGDGLVELPMAVVPGTGVPFIGTAVTLLPWPAVRAALRLVSRRAFVSLELHGLDLLDESDVPVPGLGARQPDLRVPAKEKLRRLSFVLERLADDRRVVPLAEAAAEA